MTKYGFRGQKTLVNFFTLDPFPPKIRVNILIFFISLIYSFFLTKPLKGFGVRKTIGQLYFDPHSPQI